MFVLLCHSVMVTVPETTTFNLNRYKMNYVQLLFAVRNAITMTEAFLCDR